MTTNTQKQEQSPVITGYQPRFTGLGKPEITHLASKLQGGSETPYRPYRNCKTGYSPCGTKAGEEPKNLTEALPTPYQVRKK